MYLPERAPIFSGLQGVTPMPSSSAIGVSSPSTVRSRSQYSTCKPIRGAQPRELSDELRLRHLSGGANPAVFAITNKIGSPVAKSPVALAGMAGLERRVRRIARTGRLRVAEKRAVALIHAAGVGPVATLPATSPDAHGTLAADACDAVMAAILTRPRTAWAQGMAVHAVGLRAHLGGHDQLTDGERLLLIELLDRLAATG